MNKTITTIEGDEVRISISGDRCVIDVADDTLDVRYCVRAGAADLDAVIAALAEARRRLGAGK